MIKGVLVHDKGGFLAQNMIRDNHIILIKIGQFPKVFSSLK